MVDIASRASWGARYDDGDQTLTGPALEVFVHHTVTAQLPPDATLDAERAQMRELENVGQSRFGHGISYNVLIFPSGRAYQGVSWNRRGAHTDGRNSTTRSICFVGNYDQHQPTIDQLTTAGQIYVTGKGSLWKATAPLRGHRDIKATACPGRHVYDRMGDIRAGGPNPEEDFMAGLTEAQQKALYKNVGEIETIARQNNTKLTRFEKDAAERRAADIRHQQASSARERMLITAVTELATSVGVEPGEVLARIEAKIDEIMADESA